MKKIINIKGASHSYAGQMEKELRENGFVIVSADIEVINLEDKE